MSSRDEIQLADPKDNLMIIQ